jgi:hypothetical protein
MNEQTTTPPPGSGLGDWFDKKIGALHGLPNVVHCKPTTLRHASPLIGASQTFIVQTYRAEDGDWIFLEQTSAAGHARIVLPPNVAEVIARQHDALSGRVRSALAREKMKARMAGGWRPTFGGKRGQRKAKKARGKKAAAAAVSD